MMRLGAVLVFKEHVTAQQAANALKALEGLVETRNSTAPPIPSLPPTHPGQLLHKFNDEYGMPVWYIP